MSGKGCCCCCCRPGVQDARKFRTGGWTMAGYLGMAGPGLWILLVSLEGHLLLPTVQLVGALGKGRCPRCPPRKEKGVDKESLLLGKEPPERGRSPLRANRRLNGAPAGTEAPLSAEQPRHALRTQRRNLRRFTRDANHAYGIVERGIFLKSAFRGRKKLWRRSGGVWYCEKLV